MPLNRLVLASLTLVALLIVGCSKQESAQPGDSTSKREVSVQSVSAEAKGFTVGALMSANTAYVFFETSLLAGKGGIAASASIASSVELSIKANTKLLNTLGAESVPFVVVKNAATGQTISRSGALSTAALAEMMGVDPS